MTSEHRVMGHGGARSVRRLSSSQLLGQVCARSVRQVSSSQLFGQGAHAVVGVTRGQRLGRGARRLGSGTAAVGAPGVL